MSDDETKVVSLSERRIRTGRQVNCAHRGNVEVDVESHSLICKSCSQVIDPIVYLDDWARRKDYQERQQSKDETSIREAFRLAQKGWTFRLTKAGWEAKDADGRKMTRAHRDNYPGIALDDVIYMLLHYGPRRVEIPKPTIVRVAEAVDE